MKSSTLIIIAVIGFCVICMVSLVGGGLYASSRQKDTRPSIFDEAEKGNLGSVSGSGSGSVSVPFKKGDLVKYSWTLPKGARDLCAPSEGNIKNMTAYGEIENVSNDNVGVVWMNVRNKNPREGKYEHQCCWNREENDETWNVKYWGDGSIDPSYNAGLQSQFSLKDAKRNFIKVKNTPACPEPDLFRRCKSNNDCEESELCLCPKGESNPEWCTKRGQRCKPKADLTHDRSMPLPWCERSIVEFVDAKHKMNMTTPKIYNKNIHHRKPDDIFNPQWELKHKRDGQYEIYDTKLRRGIIGSAEAAYNGWITHNDPFGARNALWRFYKVPNTNRYNIIDEKHKAAIVASDLYDGYVRHASPKIEYITMDDEGEIVKKELKNKLNAEWNVNIIKYGDNCKLHDETMDTPVFIPQKVILKQSKK